jgi:hypothetical protein
MTRNDIDDLMRDSNIVVVGEAVYALCQIVAAHEREACAKVCEERQEVFQKYYTKGLAAMCAEAIRARSEQ